MGSLCFLLQYIAFVFISLLSLLLALVSPEVLISPEVTPVKKNMEQTLLCSEIHPLWLYFIRLILCSYPPPHSCFILDLNAAKLTAYVSFLPGESG